MNGCRMLWWALAVPIGLVGLAGAIVTASLAWVLVVFVLMALALGALSANLQSLDREGRTRGRISGSTVAYHGCLAGAVVVAMFGLSSLIGAAVLPLAVLMAVTSPVRWSGGEPRDDYRCRRHPFGTCPNLELCRDPIRVSRHRRWWRR